MVKQHILNVKKTYLPHTGTLIGREKYMQLYFHDNVVWNILFSLCDTEKHIPSLDCGAQHNRCAAIDS
jgi:hypothetical protein